jgi:HTH-type transcriptional regulator/antitoxin HigA
MANKKDSNFLPIIAIPPGETIRDNMSSLGMNQEELATRLGITPKHLSNIVNGNVAITYDMALKLESVLGASANFWITLENQYQLSKARIESVKEIHSEMETFKQIPYEKMCDFGWIKKRKTLDEKISQCRDFFGVASLNLIEPAYGVMLRKKKNQIELLDLGILSWLRQSEIESHTLEVQSFDKKRRKDLMPEFNKLAQYKAEEFYPRIQELCASCGVALVVVESVPGAFICGATFWRGDKVVLALSVKEKNAELFLLAFFRELTHLIAQTRKEFHISFAKD